MSPHVAIVTADKFLSPIGRAIDLMLKASLRYRNSTDKVTFKLRARAICAEAIDVDLIRNFDSTRNHPDHLNYLAFYGI